MGCCGGRGSSGRAGRAPLIPGEGGFLVLEYTGLNDGDVSWFGAVTGARYVIGGATRQAYVDIRDAPEMLELWEGGVKQFKQVQSKPEPEPEPEPELLAPEPEVEAEPEKLEPDVLDGIVKRVTDVIAWLKTSPPMLQAEQVYEYERANANRITAVEALEAYIGGD